MVTAEGAETFARCMSVGGVAVFPSDTVYGLACEPDTAEAVRRLHSLKARRPMKAAAVMFFDLDLAIDALPELDAPTEKALEALLPGQVTLLLPNPLRRFPLACRAEGGTLGLRVPRLTDATAPLASLRWPIMQSSANLTGEPEARTLEGVPSVIREGVDLLLDGGELPGTASTVVDLREFKARREWSIVREGAVSSDAVARALEPIRG